MKGPHRYHAPAERARGRVVGPSEAFGALPWLSERIWRAADALFPVRIPRSWFERMNPHDPNDPLALQALPGSAELLADADDLDDPVGEKALSPVPWVIRKHPDRVLLMLTKRCHLYCRYCFRRTHAPGEQEDPTPEELAAALEVCRTSGAREVILSGGDPLAVRDQRLFDVIDALRPAVPVVRLHTRAPITAPERVTDALVQGLAARRPVWVIVHANHPRELSDEVADGLRRMAAAGLPLLNQSVLLRGVNDDVDTLAALSEALVALGVFPYYLHHVDRAAGNAHFRVPAQEGLALHRALSKRVSGLGLPRYVVDLPDGSGKIDVERARIAGRLDD